VGAYIPSFCDLIIMVEGNASMYLGSPRMAEMVVGEKVSLEEMGGARMHCTVSGVGDLLAHDDAEAIELARLYFSYLPGQLARPAADLPRRGAVGPADPGERARA
jgi:acetyl-CoA carboxylase carboxyltransferase component